MTPAELRALAVSATCIDTALRRAADTIEAKDAQLEASESKAAWDALGIEPEARWTPAELSEAIRSTIATKDAEIEQQRTQIDQAWSYCQDLSDSNERLREVLREVRAIFADRERYVMQGPRGFLEAEQIVIAALEAP